MKNILNISIPNRTICILFGIIIFIAILFRFVKLDQRPMHTDEAVHGIKFGQLLEENNYRYDPVEYHGPTLNYFTLVPAWIQAKLKITEINEADLRYVPAIFGLFLVILNLLFIRQIGWRAVIFASLLTAISPAMVYYSRYYIQEMLFVFFTYSAIISGFSYWKSRKLIFVIITGISIGLMHATKETCIINFAALFLSIIFTLWIQNRNFNPVKKTLFGLNKIHIILFFTSIVFTSILFFSSFFTNPHGIIDSILTYKIYLNRAGHNRFHIHPWYFYVKLLSFSKPYWSEAFIAISGILGIIFIVRNKNIKFVDISFAWFITIFTISLTVIYSLIPYKTPWSMLSFFQGFILLSGIAFSSLTTIKSGKFLSVFIYCVIILGIIHLGTQSYYSNFKYSEDPCNPYVYAHTSNDIFSIVDKINDVAIQQIEQKEIYIEVISENNDYWPLPWYLREYKNIGWWNNVDFSIPAGSIIICSEKMVNDVIKKIYEIPPQGKVNLYLPLWDHNMELRPFVKIYGYVRKAIF